MFHTLFDYQDQNVPNNNQIPKNKYKKYEKKFKKAKKHIIVIMEKETKLMNIIIRKMKVMKVIIVVKKKEISQKNLKILKIKLI